MKLAQSLIASICRNAKVFGKLTVIFVEQLKIVLAAITKCRGHDLGAFSIRNDLRFLGMTLLFCCCNAVFGFLGRSIGCSQTSTSTTSNTLSLARSAEDAQAFFDQFQHQIEGCALYSGEPFEVRIFQVLDRFVAHVPIMAHLCKRSIIFIR
ncbi:MAG: hypothetical protein QY332_05310 [Anaerolineales bacterium]|nr:MAG: hypothetical protein QY332_05310 [Anaerolineales bacterium]